ncbi:MAG: hypothetical protein OJF49_001044 [Ktedonobacterales bacterium]|jgi:hypothetical protein|nr:MAG: hypothetical protein OJF49_001044 [Ktedonobacterales bacterium]
MITQAQADMAIPDRAGSARRLRPPNTAWLADRLSDRDWQIIEIVNLLRLVTGQQLERLYFQSLTGHAREVVRGRVLRRLVRWRVLAVSPRRIGGAARGSAGAAFALGSAGTHLYATRQAAYAARQRVRHPGLPTERTVRHTLAVSELYVSLVEQARLHAASVVSFAAEPACWWPSGLGGYVKPDGYTRLALGTVRDHWWIEVDLATESLPTIKRKLSVYLDFVQRGQLGPHGVVPRVLVSTVSPERRDAVRTIVAHLPEPASALFQVVTQLEAVATMLASLHS